MPSELPGPLTSGIEVTAADAHGTRFTGVILGFNPSGLSALIRLTAGAGPGYPAGTNVPFPVRLLEAVA